MLNVFRQKRPISLTHLCGLLVFVTIFNACPPARADWTFVRGDANGDAATDIADAVSMLEALFLPVEVACEDALDANDDGLMDVADPVTLLAVLFNGAPPLPPPSDGCGIDLTDDSLTCNGPLAVCPDQGPPLSPEVNPSVGFTTSDSYEFSGNAEVGSTVRVAGPLVTEILEADTDSDGTWTIQVPLAANTLNSLFFTARGSAGQESSPTPRMIMQDSEPPFASVQSPSNGAVTFSPTTTIFGSLGDELSGIVAAATTLLVDGVDTGVAVAVSTGLGTTGSFLVADLALPLSVETSLEVRVEDSAGNSFTTPPLFVTREPLPPLTPAIFAESGDAQSANVGQWLTEPIRVRVTDASGQPFVGKIVTFEIEKNDGILGAAPLSGEAIHQAVTNGQGIAEAHWRLGSTAGTALNRVKATAVGAPEAVFFCASGGVLPGSEVQISTGMGSYQIIEVNSPATMPLRVYVSDGVNPVPDAMVLYTVVSGGGTLSATSARGGVSSLGVMTDSTGHTELGFISGDEPGNQVVEASLVAAPGQAVRFRFEAVERDPSRWTRFCARVTDATDRPLTGAQCYLRFPGVTYTAFTNDLGEACFEALDASGACQLVVHGGTALFVDGQPIPTETTYPEIRYTEVVIPNVRNRHIGTIKLPPISTANGVVFDGSADVELTLPGVDGLRITVPAGTRVTVPGDPPTIVETGSGNSTTLTLAQINFDDLPMPIPDGVAPPFAATLQPSGTRFDPPLPIEVPNFSGLAPGTIGYFMVWDQQDARFEINATGTVSPDGSRLVSDPGSGITLAGWHCNCPPYAVDGSCERCDDCPTSCTTISDEELSISGPLESLINSTLAGLAYALRTGLSVGGYFFSISAQLDELSFRHLIEQCNMCCGDTCVAGGRTNDSWVGNAQATFSSSIQLPASGVDLILCHDGSLHRVTIVGALPLGSASVGLNGEWTEVSWTCGTGGSCSFLSVEGNTRLSVDTSVYLDVGYKRYDLDPGAPCELETNATPDANFSVVLQVPYSLSVRARGGGSVGCGLPVSPWACTIPGEFTIGPINLALPGVGTFHFDQVSCCFPEFCTGDAPPSNGAEGDCSCLDD